MRPLMILLLAACSADPDRSAPVRYTAPERDTPPYQATGTEPCLDQYVRNPYWDATTCGPGLTLEPITGVVDRFVCRCQKP